VTVAIPGRHHGVDARTWRVATAVRAQQQSTRPFTSREARSPRRLAGIDLARALAMLGMLIEHVVQYPTLQPKGVLWVVYGRSAPLFVLLAGVGLSLATRARRPLDRSMVAARVPVFLLAGMALSLRGDGVILQSFALFFRVGIAAVRLPRWGLGIAAATCLVGGPLFLTELRRHELLHFFGTQTDVGFHGLVTPVAFGRGLLLSYYPAVIWLGFFFVGMLLGCSDVSSAAAGRRLFGWGAAVATLLFTAGWAGARAFGPPSDGFSLAPAPPTTWAQHWTTYGFSNSVAWALSSTALAVAIVGGCIWIVVAAPRAFTSLVALGAIPLTFYVLHFVYLGTLWTWVQPHLSSSEVAYFVAAVAFWLAFAAIARRWLARFRRGPLETVLRAIELALTSPWRLRRTPAAGAGPVSARVAPHA
jgi:uncharacterized membrane protein